MISTTMRMAEIYTGNHTFFKPFKSVSSALSTRSAEWFIHPGRWQRTRRLCTKILNIFTDHPAQTDETYLQHLWFTVKTSLHFVLLGVLLFTHGVFPFIFTRTVSTQIEGIYRMMRARIPKGRRDKIDEYSI